MSAGLNAAGASATCVAIAQADQKLLSVVDRQRIRVKAELAAIHECLKKSNMTDPISARIQNWAVTFSADVNKEKDLLQLVTKKCEELLLFLVDPISRGSLDEHSFLGSDGFTYSSKTISLHLTLQEPHKHRSPIDPSDERTFHVTPHKNVECVCKFLRKFNAIVVSEEQEKLYHALIEQSKSEKIFKSATSGKTAVTSLEDQQRLQRLQKLIAFQKDREEQSVQELERIKNIYAEKLNESANAFAGINKQIEDDHAANTARLNQLVADFNIRRQELRDRIDNLDRSIEQLAANQRQLQSQNADIQNQIQQVHAQSLELARLLDETNKELEKQRKKRKRLIKVLTAVAVVGACAFGGWMLSGALSSMGTTATGAITPTLGGGAKLSIIIPF